MAAPVSQQAYQQQGPLQHVPVSREVSDRAERVCKIFGIAVCGLGLVGMVVGAVVPSIVGNGVNGFSLLGAASGAVVVAIGFGIAIKAENYCRRRQFIQLSDDALYGSGT